MPARLAGRVALVTGASRGIGKGVTLGLGEEGCTVYVRGKTFQNGDSNRPGSVTTTAEEVSKLGGVVLLQYVIIMRTRRQRQPSSAYGRNRIVWIFWSIMRPRILRISGLLRIIHSGNPLSRIGMR